MILVSVSACMIVNPSGHCSRDQSLKYQGAVLKSYMGDMPCHSRSEPCLKETENNEYQHLSSLPQRPERVALLIPDLPSTKVFLKQAYDHAHILR